MQNKFHILFTAILISAFVVNGCKKEDPDGPAEENLALTLQKQQVIPGEIVLLSSNKPIPQESYSGTLGQESIELGRVDNDSGLAFIVPFIQEGTYNLLINGVEQEAIVVNIAPDADIADPQLIIKEVGVNIDANIKSIRDAETMGYEFDEAQLENLEILKLEFEKRAAALSSSDQLKLAAFLQANQIGQYRFHPEELTDSFYLNKKGGSKDPSAELNKLSSLFISSLAATLFAKDALVAVVRMGPPTPWKLVGVAGLSVSTGVGIITTRAIAGRMADLAGIPDELSKELNKSQFTFTNETEEKLNPKIRFRQIKREDKNHSIGFVSSLVGSLLEFENAWQAVKGALDTVQGWLSITLVDMPSSPFNIDDEPATSTFSPDIEYINFGNVSNGVTLSKEIKDGELFVTATADATTDFTFNLIYSRPDMGIKLETTIDATVKVEELCENVEITFEAAMDYQGSISVHNISGGQSPYKYSVGGSAFQDNPIFPNDYPSGSYNIIVKDTNECTGSKSFNFDRCANVSISFDVRLYSGTIEFSNVSGGTAPYKYMVDNVEQSNKIFSNNYTAGTYQLTVTDKNECSHSESQNLTPCGPTPISFQVKMTPHDPDWQPWDSAWSKITFYDVSGGESPYTYSLDGINYQTSPDFDDDPNLSADYGYLPGQYNCYVKDKNGCVKQENLYLEP